MLNIDSKSQNFVRNFIHLIEAYDLCLMIINANPDESDRVLKFINKCIESGTFERSRLKEILDLPDRDSAKFLIENTLRGLISFLVNDISLMSIALEIDPNYINDLIIQGRIKKIFINDQSILYF